LLDIVLPRLNGLQVARLLKFDEQFKHIPIILWTWKDSEEDLQWGMDSGADEYLPKPFSYPKLLTSIQKFLGENPQQFPQESS
ncbi:MAG: response regulator transcription factor, partial [bacterium]